MRKIEEIRDSLRTIEVGKGFLIVEDVVSKVSSGFGVNNANYSYADSLVKKFKSNSEDKLTVTEVLERDNVEFVSNNMILAPVGSGKTYFIQNVLAPKVEGKKLMLVSTRSLKDSVHKEGSTYTTQELRRKELNVKDENIHIMTYSEFGFKIQFDLDLEFINDYKLILCDEIHSLFDYYLSHKGNEYCIAIRTLFNSYEGKEIYYFTGTTEMVDKFVDKFKVDILRKVKIFNYLEDKDIVRNGETAHFKYSDESGLQDILQDLVSMKKSGEKGLVFNSRINGMEKIEKFLIKLGFSVGVLWSVNNKKKMDEKQLKLRETLLETGIIPDEYDFVIINEAMREGWNLVDERVKVVIVNDSSETNQVQARGRVRHNISLLVTLDNSTLDTFESKVVERESKIKLFESLVGEELTADEMKNACLEFNVSNHKSGRPSLFVAIQPVLEKVGFKFDKKRKVVNGKKVVVYSVSKVEEVAKKSEVEKSKMFLGRLGRLGLFEKNAKFFNNYMSGKGKAVALNQIVVSYNNLVLTGKMTEENFELATYSIIKSRNIFTVKFYLEKAESLNKLSKMKQEESKEKAELLAIVAGFTSVEEAVKAGVINIDEIEVEEKVETKKQVEIKRSAEEEELLAYIANNGGL